MKKTSKTKLPLLITITLILLSTIPTRITITTADNKTINSHHPSILKNTTTLYVGGTGPENYTHIQHALDNASDNDTVYVYDDSSPYKETLMVNCSVQLIGENKHTTIIDAEGLFGEQGSIIYIQKPWVHIHSFTLKSSMTGIRASHQHNITIQNNIIKDIEIGIYLHEVPDSQVINNIIQERDTITFNFQGIYYYQSDRTIIENNTIELFQWNQFDCGIYPGRSRNCELINNNLKNCSIRAWEDLYEHNWYKGNTKDGKPIIYLKNTTNAVIDNAAQIILINCHKITIQDLPFDQTYIAIILSDCSECEIRECTFTKSYLGIRLTDSNNNTIKDNIIYNGQTRLLRQFDMSIGIECSSSEENTIQHNRIQHNGVGIYLLNADHNTIHRNHIIGNRAVDEYYFRGISGGIYCEFSSDNFITKNTFKQNIPHVWFRGGSNTYYRNYWGRPHLFPKPLFGIDYIPWQGAQLLIQWDRRPSLRPYIL